MAARAGLYTRISQDRTGMEAGVTRQLKDCKALLKKLGWTEVDVYRDNDMSASKGRRPRPDYNRMKADLASGRIDALVGWHPDRFYRTTRELDAVIDLIEDTGAAIATVKAGIVDLTTPTGRLQARIGASVAQYEVEHMGDKISRKAQEKAEAGQWNGGPRPFGYRVAEGRLVPHPAEAKLVRQAVADALDNGVSMRTIARQWSGKLGRPIHSSQVKRVLVSARIAGLRDHKGTLHPAGWDPLVPRERWEEICAVLKDPGRASVGRPHEYLLSGIAVCGGAHPDGRPCGANLVSGGRSGGRGTAYRCHADRGGCGRTSRSATHLDSFVEAVLIEYLAGPKLARLIKAATQGDKGAAKLLAARQAAEAKLERGQRRYLDAPDLVDEGVFRKWQAELVAEIGRLNAQIATAAGNRILADLPSGRAAVEAWWARDDLAWKREVLRSVFARVVVNPTRRGPGFRSDDIDIVPVEAKAVAA